MFGFLGPESPTAAYRSVYSRCCQYQRKHYGLRSLPLLSYEAVFLYLLWLDASGRTADALSAQKCCRLRQLNERTDLQDSDVGLFCASVSMLLAGVKLEDDLRDGPSLRSRAASRMLRGPVRKARHYFDELDGAFTRAMCEALEEHASLEQFSGHMGLNTYAEPTARSFGNLFVLVSKLNGARHGNESLRRIGRHIGTSIIAFDCASDWYRDRESGNYNPLETPESIERALDMSRTNLAQAAALCRVEFGDSSQSGAVLGSIRKDLTAVTSTASAAPTLSQRLAFGLGAVASMAQSQSDSKSDDGSACGALICCSLCALALRGKLVGTAKETTDCCGNKQVEYRKPGPCDC